MLQLLRDLRHAAEEAIEMYSADEDVTISACERVLERSE